MDSNTLLFVVLAGISGTATLVLFTRKHRGRRETQGQMFIYFLSDPRTGVVYYVGKTNDLKRRYNEHVKGANPLGTKASSRWIAQLRAEGLVPRMSVRERCTTATVDGLERQWVQYGVRHGWPLTNQKLRS